MVRFKKKSLIVPKITSGPIKKVPTYTPSFVTHANPATACKYQTWAQKQWHISNNTHPLDSPERNWTWELIVVRPFLCWTWWLVFQVRYKLVCVKEDNITTEWNKPEGNLIYYMPRLLFFYKQEEFNCPLSVNYCTKWLPTFYKIIRILESRNFRR